MSSVEPIRKSMSLPNEAVESLEEFQGAMQDVRAIVGDPRDAKQPRTIIG